MGRISDWWSGLWAQDLRDPQPQPFRGDAITTESGVVVTEEAGLTLPAVFGAMRNIGEDVASLPLFTYKHNAKGRAAAYWRPEYALLHDKPNPAMSPIDMWGATVYAAQWWGAGFVFVERTTAPGVRWDGFNVTHIGDPLSLWPVQRANRMITWLNGGELMYSYLDYNGEAIPFAANEIIPVRGFSKDGVYGLGVMKAGAEAIGLGLAQQTLATTFFGNGTRVGGKLIIPPGLRLSETAKSNLEQSLIDRRRPENKWKTITLEDGVTFEDDVIDAEKSQILQSRTFTVREVCRLTRETPDALADLADANYNNIEMQAINRATRTLRPWCVRIAQAVNGFLIPDADRSLYYAEHNMDAVLQADIKTRYEAFGMAVDKGWMSRNEVRAKENLNSMGSIGDAYTIQQAQTTIEHVIEGDNLRTAVRVAGQLGPQGAADELGNIQGADVNVDTGATPTMPPGKKPVA